MVQVRPKSSDIVVVKKIALIVSVNISQRMFRQILSHKLKVPVLSQDSVTILSFVYSDYSTRCVVPDTRQHITPPSPNATAMLIVCSAKADSDIRCLVGDC